MRFFKRIVLYVVAGALLVSMCGFGQLSGLPPALTLLKGKAHTLPAFVAPSATEAGFLFAKNGPNLSVTPTTPGDFQLRFSSLGLFGKTVNVRVVEEDAVEVLGELVGIKMYMDGVLVIGLSEIPGTGIAPGKKAGIRAGDRILTVNGKPIQNSEMLTKTVAESAGMPLEIERERDGQKQTLSIQPVYYAEGAAYKLGLWVRDSAAGVGTLTFSRPESGRFGALGHAIADADTKTVVSVEKGAVTAMDITHIQKGERGAPGAVQGVFGEEIGTIAENTAVGIYGTLSGAAGGKILPLGLSNEVEKGPCIVYSDIEGGKPRAYAAEIEAVYPRQSEETKSMCLRITDERLLAYTGGIIQGMSGSPIEQNGKLIGAITHVFVNDPARGYGIFIENMLENA